MSAIDYITGNEGSRRKPLLYVEAVSQTRDGRKVVAHFGDLSLWVAIDGKLAFSSTARTPVEAEQMLQNFAARTGIDELVVVKGMLAAAKHRAIQRSTSTKG